MLKITKFLLFTALLSFPAVHAQNSLNGFLSVQVSDGIPVYIDSTFIGTNSFSYLKIPVGIYTLHAASRNSLDWSERGYSKQIEIKAGEYLNVNLANTSQIRFKSLPIGIDIYIGDQLVGVTPFTLNKNLLGTNSLKLSKSGYQTQIFQISPDQNEYVVQMTPLTENNQLGVSRVSENQYELKWYREGLVVTSLLGSWASFYFKRQADQSYAKYQRASDAREMVALFSQTQKYDTLADIAIGVSVATLGTYFYLLLTD